MPSTDANDFHITIINKTSFFTVIYSNYCYYELIYMFSILYLVRGGLRTLEPAPLTRVARPRRPRINASTHTY